MVYNSSFAKTRVLNLKRIKNIAFEIKLVGAIFKLLPESVLIYVKHQFIPVNNCMPGWYLTKWFTWNFDVFRCYMPCKLEERTRETLHHIKIIADMPKFRKINKNKEVIFTSLLIIYYYPNNLCICC